MISKIPFCLAALLVVVLAVASVVDPSGTTGPAAATIYGRWWFVALWGILALTACWAICKARMWRRPALFLLHVSFGVILAGAAITHFTSRRGFIHLRQGEVTNQYMYRSEDGQQLLLHGMPFLMALDTFSVRYDADGVTPADYVSQVTILDHKDRQTVTISMNRIGREHGYRIFQTSYDDDLHGSLFTVSYDPWGTAVTYLGYVLLAISMVWLGIRLKVKSEKLKIENEKLKEKAEGRRSVFGFQFSVFLGVLLASYMIVAIAFRPLMPVLRSPMLFIHVGVIMVSYVLLIVSMVRREVLRHAVFFLAAGIFLGALWANISWGSYWSWDPKETWAIITLLVYSIPLHQQSLPWFRSMRHYRLYSIFCLLCLLMTYFGVNFLLGGMHSYAS